MNEASSIAAFRSKRLEQFRYNLERSVKQVIDNALVSETSLITSYNGKLLTDEFSEKVDWPGLCRHHDGLYSGRHVVESTPLKEICSTMVQFIPFACTAITIKVLISAILKMATQYQDQTTQRFLPSQALLLGKITLVLNRSPSTPCKLVFQKVLDGSNLNSSQLNLLVSITYQLAQDCQRFRNDMLEIMFQVMQILDEMLKLSSAERISDVAGEHRAQPVQRRVKRQRYALSDLHDEDLCHGTSTYFSSARFPAIQPVVSLKKVLQTNDSSTRELAANPFDLEAYNLTVRALIRAYKKVVKISASHHHPLRIFAASIHNQSEKKRLPSIQMCGWMKIMKLQPTRPSLRLALMLSVSRHQPADLATLYWQAYETSKDSIWLRFFSELIASARYFDDPQHCWTATERLWEHLEATVEDPDAGALAAWAHLLNTRGSLWQYQNTEEFIRRNSICSVQYGDAEHWRLGLPQFSMALQKHAILGLMELSRWEGDTNVDSGLRHGDTDERSRKDCFQEWPFEESFTIMGAWSRLTDGNASVTKDSIPPEFRSCLSSSTHLEDLLTSTSHLKDEDGKTDSEPVSILPLLEHLNSDIQLSIFSYLDHLDLVRVRAVCRFWNKAISDDKAALWHNAYKHRFGQYQLEEPLTDNGNVHWFWLFRNKHLMEMPLRFKRNTKTAYKHHTCNYIGCGFVVKSEKKKAQHEQSHLRRIAKRKEMEERERERQRKRKLREEEKEQREQERLLVQYFKEEAERERNGG